MMEYGAEKCVKQEMYIEITIKTEGEEVPPSTAQVDIEIDVDHLKEEPGLVPFVNSKPALLVKKEILVDSKQGADVQESIPVTPIRAIIDRTNVVADSVGQEELLHIKEDPEKTELPYGTDQSDVDHLKEEPGLVHFVNSKPTLLVKKEILVDSKQGADVQQSIPVTPRRAIIERTNVVADSDGQGELLHIKEDPENIDVDIAPTVLQHMELPYGTDQMDLNDIEPVNPSLNKDPEEFLSRTEDHQVVCSQVKDGTIDQSKDISYKCDKCVRTFKSKETLKKHHQRMHGTESHRCTKCNKEFKCRAYLRIHHNYVHSNQQYECSFCKKVFKSKRALGDHLLRVRGHKPASSHSYIYTCDYCQKTFWRKPSLRQHIQCVHGERTHPCRKCNKAFKFKCHLQRHITRTHGKPQHECEVCHKLYTKRSLNTHVKKAHCLKGIPSRSNLRSQVVWDSHPIAGDLSAVVGAGTDQHGTATVKVEPVDAELELGPVVFQHKDSNYRPYKESHTATDFTEQ